MDSQLNQSLGTNLQHLHDVLGKTRLVHGRGKLEHLSEELSWRALQGVMKAPDPVGVELQQNAFPHQKAMVKVILMENNPSTRS